MFKTKPMDHQETDYKRSKDMDAFALFWEQGTGKSKLSIDTFAHHYREGIIDGVLIVAPNSVHRNWLSDEIPKHLADDVAERTFSMSYLSGKAQTQWQQQTILRCLGHDGLALMTMSYDAFITPAGKKMVKKMLKLRKLHMVLDESHHIKAPKAKRSISIMAAGRYPVTKRILTGTPVANSPFDVYSQIKFLDEFFWKRKGVDTFQIFKHIFGVYAHNPKTHSDFIVDYKQLDLLKEWIAPISSRVLKEDVLDLPPKTYTRRTFEMSPKQRKLYSQLKNEFIAILDSGEEISVPLKIVRMMRLQQVTCGYLPSEDEDNPIHYIDKQNTRLAVVKETIEELHHPVIIWARFRLDIDQICEFLGKRCVRFDGKVDSDGREVAKKRFRNGDVQFFVANPAVGGTGLTLVNAKTMIYYNNSFKLTERLQSEDRFHRIGQNDPVSIVDIMAEDTIDYYIVRALRKKLEIASLVTGDGVREWL